MYWIISSTYHRRWWGTTAMPLRPLDVSIEPANPGDLTLNSATTDGPVAVLWLSGGQSGTVYTINLTIGTVNGRTDQPSRFSCRSFTCPFHLSRRTLW